MFKKERDLAERSKTLLKNKEVRSLKTEICKQFPNVQEEELNSVIPNKADITLTKLANKTLLYSIDGVILFFDVNARNNLYPTLPFLWRFPTALPTLIIYSPVSEFVLRGADLMTPGLCTSLLPEMAKLGLKEGDKACVRIVGNPLPFAVGDCLFNTSILADGVRHKGRALTVHHVYGDLLNTSGVVPNAGFGPSRIYPIETAESVGETAQHDFEEEGSEDDSEDEEEKGSGDEEDGVDGDGNEGEELREQGKLCCNGEYLCSRLCMHCFMNLF